MDTRNLGMLIQTVIFSVLISSTAFAVPMKLTTPEGYKLLLNDDNTWTTADGKDLTVDRDFTVPLGDGRIILIGADNSWGFVTKELKYAEDDLLTTTVVGKGQSSNTNVEIAKQAAFKQAMDNCVRKIPGVIKTVKMSAKKIPECVQAVEKDVTNNEQFVKDKGWTATSVITLDRGALLAIIGCASDTSRNEVK